MSIVMKVGKKKDIIPKEESSAVEEVKPHASIKMKARKTIDGNILILDHSDIDIIVIPKTNKVLTLAKNTLSEDVYDTQNRLFRYLTKKGVVDPSTIRSGNVYGSLEAVYPKESYNGADTTQLAIFGVGKFLEEERAFYEYSDRNDQQMVDFFTKPEDTTELGAVKQEPRKGSIDPNFAQSLTGYFGQPYFEE